jgi:hypothetical protein
MDVENAANILAGSILTMLSLVIVVIGIVVINNIFHRYWKPVEWMKMLNHPMYATKEDLVEPKFKETK